MAASVSRNTRIQSVIPLAVLASLMILDAVDGSTNPTVNAMAIIRMSNGLPFSSYVDSSIAFDCLTVKKPCRWLAVLMDNSRVVLMGTGWAITPLRMFGPARLDWLSGSGVSHGHEYCGVAGHEGDEAAGRDGGMSRRVEEDDGR